MLLVNKPRLKAKPELKINSSPQVNKQAGWDLYRDGISKSMLEKFHACPEKMRLSYIQGIKGDYDSANLRFGNTVHSAIERMYRDGVCNEARSEQRIKEILMDIRRADIKKAATAVNKASILETIEENHGKAIAVVLGYYRYWKETDSKRKWIDLEKEFDILFSGIRIRGKIDGSYRPDTGKIWIKDIKTKGQINENNLRLVMSNDLQLNIYGWAAKQLYNEPVAGVEYDIIRNPQLRQKQTEDKANFIARIAADIETRPEFYFMRFSFPFSEKEIAAWEKEFQIMLEEITRWANNIPRFNYKRTSSCETRYGRCEFLNYCASNSLMGYTKRTEIFPELKGVEPEI